MELQLRVTLRNAPMGDLPHDSTNSVLHPFAQPLQCCNAVAKGPDPSATKLLWTYKRLGLPCAAKAIPTSIDNPSAPLAALRPTILRCIFIHSIHPCCRTATILTTFKMRINSLAQFLVVTLLASIPVVASHEDVTTDSLDRRYVVSPRPRTHSTLDVETYSAI